MSVCLNLVFHYDDRWLSNDLNQLILKLNQIGVLIYSNIPLSYSQVSFSSLPRDV